MYFVFLCFYKNEINITNKKKQKHTGHSVRREQFGLNVRPDNASVRP